MKLIPINLRKPAPVYEHPDIIPGDKHQYLVKHGGRLHLIRYSHVPDTPPQQL